MGVRGVGGWVCLGRFQGGHGWRLGWVGGLEFFRGREGVDTIILFSNVLSSFILFPSSSLSRKVAGREGWGEWKVVTASHFSNAMTA